MWKVTYNGKENPTDYQVNAKDARTGETAFHFWSANEMDFSIEQEVTGLEPGTYQLSAFSQGGDMLSSSVLELYAYLKLPGSIPYCKRVRNRMIYLTI